MSRGIYIRSKKHKENLSKAHKPHKHSETTRRKISQSMKGRILTWEHKQKISESCIGRKPSSSIWKKGEHSNLKAEFKRGNVPWNKNMLGYLAGEKHHNWKGGISFEPYTKEFNNQLKEKIRKRDNYKCQECGKIQKQLKRKLAIHHIDFNKNNNNPLNLISLCDSCHIKTNYNRKHWKRYFQMQIFIRELFNPENVLIFNENQKEVIRKF